MFDEYIFEANPNASVTHHPSKYGKKFPSFPRSGNHHQSKKIFISWQGSEKIRAHQRKIHGNPVSVQCKLPFAVGKSKVCENSSAKSSPKMYWDDFGNVLSFLRKCIAMTSNMYWDDFENLFGRNGHCLGKEFENVLGRTKRRITAALGWFWKMYSDAHKYTIG
eukprot:8131915-Karenia_brevis.AAC.1